MRRETHSRTHGRRSVRQQLGIKNQTTTATQSCPLFRPSTHPPCASRARIRHHTTRSGYREADQWDLIKKEGQKLVSAAVPALLSKRRWLSLFRLRSPVSAAILCSDLLIGSEYQASTQPRQMPRSGARQKRMTKSASHDGRDT